MKKSGVEDLKIIINTLNSWKQKTNATSHHTTPHHTTPHHTTPHHTTPHHTTPHHTTPHHTTPHHTTPHHTTPHHTTPDRTTPLSFLALMGKDPSLGSDSPPAFSAVTLYSYSFIAVTRVSVNSGVCVGGDACVETHR